VMFPNPVEQGVQVELLVGKGKALVPVPWLPVGPPVRVSFDDV
jgi:hypothetical protein